ncbi:MAG: PaaI family thioesterase [Afipia sp.]|jgi:uncharacterized protein (TIGR00369 family)|nr:PaaI family thioesterase [Afipia sp.]
MTASPEAHTDLLARLNNDVSGTFAAILGLRFVEASPDCIVAEMDATENQTSRQNVIHGGVLMAIADTVGGFSTRINLLPGQGTTTIESKTNFLRAATPGSTLRARADVLHKGRTTMVWQTIIRDEKERVISITTQTQMVIAAKS